MAPGEGKYPLKCGDRAFPSDGGGGGRLALLRWKGGCQNGVYVVFKARARVRSGRGVCTSGRRRWPGQKRTGAMEA